MKREILFRGKRVDNGEWVEGFYFTTPLTDGKTDSKPEDGWFFLTGKTRHVISRNSCVYEVNPDTIGQFTGLTDKNGKMIFDGDVVEICKSYGYGFLPKGSHVHAEWCGEELCFKLNGTFHLTSKKIVKVVGNIHDNSFDLS